MSDAEYQVRLKAAGRNDPCPCGSGRKYKKCHLVQDEAAQHQDAAKAQAAAAEAISEETASAKKKATPGGQATPRQKQHGDVKRQGQDTRPNNLPRRKAV
jgi:hypothetical protein